MNRSVWVVALVTTAFHLATATIYGYHRDEFYYLASGRRLAWGYVDHPPLTPLLYRAADRVFGHSELGLRVTPAVLHGVIVVLAALLARELGGSPRAQLIAALGAAVTPFLLGTGHFLSTVTVEIVFWTAITLALVKLLNGADPRLWIVVGVVVGVGLLDKWTTGFLIIGLVIGLLLTPERSVLWTPWSGVGALVAGAIVAPNLLWQADRGWPQLEFAGTLRNYGQAVLTAPIQLVLLGAVSVLLALPGFLWLLRDGSAGRYRALGIAFIVVVVLVMVTGGKPYYASVFAPVLIAAGAVSVTMHSSTRFLPAILVVTGVLLAPLATPLLPMSTLGFVRAINPEEGEMVGWPQLVDQVAHVYREHPGATILTQNYSEAGSIELLGGPRGMSQPISGHNTYWYWGHPQGRSPVTIAVGFTRARLERMFGDVEHVATFHAPGGVHNLENGASIWVCREQRADWSTLWPSLRSV
jgi:4-amino-4-deoxy-L-arabinose transferase-like glycosyltransferase